MSRWQQGNELQLASHVSGGVVGNVVLDKRLGEPGREGEVWSVARSHIGTKAVKLFDQPQVKIPRVTGLVAAMSTTSDWSSRFITAPERIASFEGLPVGYMMPMLNDAWMPLRRAFKNRSLLLEKRRELALDLAESLSFVNKRNFVVGDLQPENLRFRLEGRSIAIFDVDSWGYLPDGGDALFPSLSEHAAVPPILFHPDYAPSGTQAPSFESDRFALAVLVVEIVMGHHPFGASPASKIDQFSAPADRIQLGETWLLRPEDYVLDQRWFGERHPGLDFLPDSFGGLVRRSLIDGGKNPTAYEWQVLLSKLRILKCKKCSAQMFQDGMCAACTSTPPRVAQRIDSPPHLAPTDLQIGSFEAPPSRQVTAQAPKSSIQPPPTKPARRRPSSPPTKAKPQRAPMAKKWSKYNYVSATSQKWVRLVGLVPGFLLAWKLLFQLNLSHKSQQVETFGIINSLLRGKPRSFGSTVNPSFFAVVMQKPYWLLVIASWLLFPSVLLFLLFLKNRRLRAIYVVGVLAAAALTFSAGILVRRGDAHAGNLFAALIGPEPAQLAGSCWYVDDANLSLVPRFRRQSTLVRPNAGVVSACTLDNFAQWERAKLGYPKSDTGGKYYTQVILLWDSGYVVPLGAITISSGLELLGIAPVGADLQQFVVKVGTLDGSSAAECVVVIKPRSISPSCAPGRN